MNLIAALRSRLPRSATSWGVTLTAAFLLPVAGGVPEPDNVVWGTIHEGNTQVLATATDVVVEARRTASGSAIASYTMGDIPAAGNFYSLRITVESESSESDTTVVTNGTLLYVTVVRAGAVVNQAPFTVGRTSAAPAVDVRGHVVRLDFGDTDSDGDGLSDKWEALYFGTSSAGAAGTDTDGDGLSNLAEYQGGTNPLVKDARHPADNAPGNNYLSITEVTAYGLAWKTGATWPVAPNPIDVNYVTKAGVLWKNGEYYVLNTAVSAAAPGWWTNATLPGAALASVSAEGGPSLRRGGLTPAGVSGGIPTSTVVRQLPSSAAPGTTTEVLLVASPPPGTSAWAVEEVLPSGLGEAQADEHGRFDKATRTIRWGPFFDDEPREFRYRIGLPAVAAADWAFAGVGSFDGSSIATAGGKWLPQAGAVPSLGVRRAGGGRFLVQLNGQRGRGYRLESAGALAGPWLPLEVRTADAAGQIQFEPPATDGASAFFRAILVEDSADALLR